MHLKREDRRIVADALRHYIGSLEDVARDARDAGEGNTETAWIGERAYEAQMLYERVSEGLDRE